MFLTDGYQATGLSRLSSKRSADANCRRSKRRLSFAQLFFEVLTSIAEIWRMTFELPHFGHFIFFFISRSYSANDRVRSNGFSQLRQKNS
jgi:hypothetical protein